VFPCQTFRIHSDKFTGASACDLLVCDEAHRLKNDETQTSQCLNKLQTRRRVLLSGTPLQNDLEEFFAMVREYFFLGVWMEGSFNQMCLICISFCLLTWFCWMLISAFSAASAILLTD
jgi:hypothetical protein